MSHHMSDADSARIRDDALNPFKSDSKRANETISYKAVECYDTQDDEYMRSREKLRLFGDQKRETNWLASGRSKVFILLFFFMLAMSSVIIIVVRNKYRTIIYSDEIGAYDDDDDDDDNSAVDVDRSSGDDDYATDDYSLVFSTSNSYGKTKSSSSLQYPFLSGNNQLFEPYKEHTLRVHNINTDYFYSYSIVDSSGDETFTGEMTVDTYNDKDVAFFTATLEMVGQYELTITEYNEEKRARAAVVQAISAIVHCKYIRREITSLSDADREEYLDALYALWSTNTVDGMELYGEKYKSLYYLATVHIDGGANPICDEFHSKSGGFLSNHVMLNQYMEQSLQLVNPRVALHYVEYPKYFTEDYDDSFWTKHMKNTLDGGSWSELLSDKYFGSNDPYTGEIIDGRWADAEIPEMDDQFFADHGIPTDRSFFPEEESAMLKAGASYHLQSPLGLLRSPWNFNPSRRIARFNNVNQIAGGNVDLGIYNFYEGVDCTDWTDFALDVKNQDIMDFMAYMEDDAHGKIHFTFGGSGGDPVIAIDEQLRSDYGFDNDDLVVTAQYTQTLVKQRYVHYNMDFSEHNFMEMSFNCNSTTRECELNPWYTEDKDEDRIDYFFTNIFYSTVDDTTPQYDVVEKALALNGYNEKEALAILLISRFQYDGDMAGASAAVDPLFWIVHASMEKLYQKMREQSFFSSTEYYSVDGHKCSGHDPDSAKNWLQGYYMMNESIDASRVTNAEWVEYLNPMGDLYADNFNFVYDSFDYSSWCPSLAEAVDNNV